MVLERPLEFFLKKSLEMQTSHSRGGEDAPKTYRHQKERKELDPPKILT